MCEHDGIDEGEEVLVPAFELSSNPQWSIHDGSFIGNFANQPDGSVRHFSELSFLMWFDKSGLDDWVLSAHPVYGMAACFELGEKTHWIQDHLLKDRYTYEDVERLASQREWNEELGKMVVALVKRMKRFGTGEPPQKNSGE